jgi:hypothetical protein
LVSPKPGELLLAFSLSALLVKDSRIEVEKIVPIAERPEGESKAHVERLIRERDGFHGNSVAVLAAIWYAHQNDLNFLVHNL